MSRDGRDDAREDPREPAPRTPAPRGLEKPEPREPTPRAPERPEPDRPEPTSRRPDVRRPGVPMDRLTLPRGLDREALKVRGHVYRLRESESRILATVGTFRVVRADDLQPMRSSCDVWTGDLRSLAEQGLVQSLTVDVNRESTAVVVLTRAGRDVLEANRSPGEGRAQAFHAGLVNLREIAHDSQLFRLYQAEAERIETDGGRITRVILDHELKHDYQTFLNRPHRPTDADRTPDTDRAADIEAFAAVSQLPVVDGHLELPDLRIEFETADGRLEHRDVELVTEHYSRSQLAGKRAAGFALYRAAGAGRPRGSSARAGGTQLDPHHLEGLI